MEFFKKQKHSQPKNSQSKYPKIIVFKSIQEKFTVVGISPKLATQPYPLNKRIVTCFLLLSTAMTFICVYIFNYAKTMVEYMQSINMAADGFLMTFALTILVSHAKKLFEFINRCDAIVNTSECD